MSDNEKKNYLTIHGHFYQPPRENPWLEAIELQESASPFHDWNARICDECYNPNSASRIVDGKNRIIDIVNNYTMISFNFGPTLMSWMEQYAPNTYERIVQADRKSIGIYSGHGNAIAQVYNHMIMPLANDKDKYTQTINIPKQSGVSKILNIASAENLKVSGLQKQQPMTEQWKC